MAMVAGTVMARRVLNAAAWVSKQMMTFRSLKANWVSRKLPTAVLVTLTASAMEQDRRLADRTQTSPSLIWAATAFRPVVAQLVMALAVEAAAAARTTARLARLLTRMMQTILFRKMRPKERPLV